MPAGMVRPRASQVDPLGPAAVDGYRAAGWRITPGGRVCSGTTTGPCGACRRPTTRYGPAGQANCPACRTTTTNGHGDE